MASVESAQWTPIKVAGKNTRDRSKAGLAKRNTVESNTRRRGRPTKSRSIASHNSSRSTTPFSAPPDTYNQTKNGSRQAPRISWLEQLPAEIIQSIFLYCLSCDLPRASPILGQMLSSEHIYIRSAWHAFGPSWAQGVNQTFSTQPSHYITKNILEGDSDLQTRLLKCRWASLTLLQKAEESWLVNYRKKSLQFHLKASLLKEDSKWEGKKFDDELENDYQMFVSNVKSGTWTGSIFTAPRELRGLLLVHKNTLIPESLLQGPWTDEITRHLHYLVRAGARVDWVSSTTGEVADEGYQVAKATGNKVIQALLMILVFDEGTKGSN